MVNKVPTDFPERVALVHEWFSSRSTGGAEQVVHAIDNLILSLGSKPQLFSLVESESARPDSWLFGRSIETSFIQNLPFGSSHVQRFLPLLPYAIEQIDLSDYPLVVSSNHLVAKGILTSPDQLHISYIHTPVRYAWDQMNVYLKRSSLRKVGLEPLIRWQLHQLRQWDQLSAARVDCILANSSFTARRIFKYWGRRAQIVHPPVEVDRFSFCERRDEYYLCLCRLVPNKKVDVVVEAFNLLKLPLIIVGEGPERNYLEKIAGPNIEFLGFQSRRNVERLMERCRAYVYAGVEDFGIAPVEAMAAGAPVIALAKGGLLDTITCARKDINTSTGVLFSNQTMESLFEAVSWFEEKRIYEKLSPELINQRAQEFRPEVFSRNFQSALKTAWEGHLKSSLCGSFN
ncbi:glycosyltransferase [Prochlorococcus marinus]|uniref:Glycosyltransferase n=1 Tax=Prochlorococcus marinus (strain MIT 9211) TaxID=93059 RepID=A9BBT5_PROM4|nr:glycosyltransferase [Prochlorococcus marinus]ABX09297.1 Glycosyltransferase [Prochlorococcus marinus str. MIT 9211]